MTSQKDDPSPGYLGTLPKAEVTITTQEEKLFPPKNEVLLQHRSTESNTNAKGYQCL